MKILFILLLPFTINAQVKKWNKPFITGNDIVIYSAQFVAGSADGLHEVLVNHVHTFERVWPHANFNWWEPELSQNNKKHFLTILSDGYHTTRTIEHTMNYFSIGFSLCDLHNYSKKQLPLLIVKKMLLSMIVNRIGFNIVYNGIFNDKQERPK